MHGADDGVEAAYDMFASVAWLGGKPSCRASRLGDLGLCLGMLLRTRSPKPCGFVVVNPIVDEIRVALMIQ